MAEDAVAGVMEVRVGLLPDVGGCSRLPAVVGLGKGALNEVFEETETRSIITHNQSPDVGFDYSVNCYRGCAHACRRPSGGRCTSSTARAAIRSTARA